MEKFLERLKLPKLTQEEIQNWNGPITRNWVSNYNPTKKSQAQLALLINSTRYLKKVQCQIFTNSGIRRGGNTSLSCWGQC